MVIDWTWRRKCEANDFPQTRLKVYAYLKMLLQEFP